MSNNVELISNSLNQTYPVFEPNQLLTSNHLNQLRNYLDTQDRMSRVNLIGIGIVCGLEVSFQLNTLKISKGTGVTSEGFLVQMEEEEFTKCAESGYADSQNYHLFTDTENPETGQFELWELLADGASTKAEVIDFNEPAFVNFMNDKVVLLFMEYKDIDLESCLGQNCDDKGIAREFTVRKLLINCSDAEKLIRRGYKIPVEITKVDRILNKRFEPDFISMLSYRLLPYETAAGEMNAAFAAINGSEYLINRYAVIYPDAEINPLSKLAVNLKQAYGIYKPIVGHLESEEYINGLEDKLKGQKAIYDGKIGFQYFFDYTKDLVKAYNEFVERAFDIVALCSPNTEYFPRHLLLAKVIKDEVCIENTCKPAIFRTHFIQSPIYNQQKDKIEEVKSLFIRLILMTKEFVEDLSEFEEVRITPSNEKQGVLNKRAIPFYYTSLELYKYWNYELTKRCRAQWNIGYHSENFLPNVNSSQNPLFFDMDAYNFYRIESTIGKPYKEVRNRLEILKRLHQLDFNVLPLKLRLSDADLPLSNCGLVDLKEDYLQLRNEIIIELNLTNTFLKKSYSVAAGIASFENETDDPKKTDEERKRDLLEKRESLNRRELIEELMLKDIDFEDRKIIKEVADKDTQKYLAFFKLKLDVDMISEVMELLKLLPKCIDDFKLDEFLEKNKELKKTIYHTTLWFETLTRGLGAKGLFFDYFFKRMSIDEDYFTGYENGFAFLNSTIDIRLGSIIYSYNRRKEAYRSENLFSNFTRKNPGIQHMAGVPKGGTFILVYEQEGENENVVADFSIESSACCCEPKFPICEKEELYPPIARNSYHFYNDSKVDEVLIVEIDVFNEMIDLNIKKTRLLDLLGINETENGAQIRIIFSDRLKREVIEYRPAKLMLKDELFDTFEYRICHEDDRKVDAVGTVYVSTLPGFIQLNEVKEALCCSDKDDPREDTEEEAKRKEEARLEEARLAEEKRKEEARLAEEKRKREEGESIEESEEEAKRKEEARLAEEKRKREEGESIEESEEEAKRKEEARLAEEKRKKDEGEVIEESEEEAKRKEEARLAEDKRKKDEGEVIEESNEEAKRKEAARLFEEKRKKKEGG